MFKFSELARVYDSTTKVYYTDPKVIEYVLTTPKGK